MSKLKKKMMLVTSIAKIQWMDNFWVEVLETENSSDEEDQDIASD